MVVKHISFFSLFLYVILGTSNHIFGARAPRQRSRSSLEVRELSYWAQKPERWQDLKQLAKEFYAKESRRMEEERKQIVAERAREKLYKNELCASLCSAIEQRDLAAAKIFFKSWGQEFPHPEININVNSSLSFLRMYCRLSGYDDPSDQNSDCKYTLLHSAVIKRDVKFAEFLLALGADPNLCLDYTDFDENMFGWYCGPSAFDIAVETKDQDMVGLLTQSVQKKYAEKKLGDQ